MKRFHHPWRHLAGALAAAAILGLSVPGSASPGGKATDTLSPAEQGLLHRAGQAMEKEQWAEAARLLAPAANRDGAPPHYLVPFMLGNALAMAGDYAGALGHYRRAVQIHPDDAAIWRNMARACFEQEKYEAAGAHLLEAHRRASKKDPELVFQAASCFLRAGQAQKALPHLERLCTRCSGDLKPEWVEALVRACFELKCHARGAVTTAGLLERTDGDPKWWKFLAHLHLRDGKARKAAAAWRIYTTTATPGKKDLLFLADLYRMAGVPLMAAQQYERVRKWGNEPALWEKIASSYLAGHRPDRAAEILALAVAEQPTARLWRMLAQVEYRQERFPEAYRAFEQCLRLDPKNGPAILSMGYCALRSDDQKAAMAAFQRALAFPAQRKAAAAALRSTRARAGLSGQSSAGPGPLTAQAG